jgi:serine phosphatase RsbU (regulator of sigma subunit)
MAAQAGAAIENARLFEAERRAQEQSAQDLEATRLLLEAASKLNSWTSLDVLLNGLADVVLRATRHTRAYVALLSEDRSQATFVTTVGKDPLPARTVLAWDQLSSALQDVLTDGRRKIVDYSKLREARRGVAGSLDSRLALLVPILFGDRVLGHIAIDDPGERSEFTDREIALIEGIASQAAVAIENARLYDEQRHIAAALQDNLIHPLPQVAGLELGMVAQTAFEPELVGGDFSDVFLLDDRSVLVTIGDVAGKGVRAAGLTETVRAKIRAFATIDPSPAYMLGKTSELMLRLDPDDPHVTVFCALLDPHTGRLSYASAGHPAPFHLGAFTCRPLAVAFGPPLGTFERPYTDSHAILTIEDYLVLYTDGVTEARRDGELLGERRLLEIVAGLRGRSAQEVADGVRDAALAFAGGRLNDDLQVVVLRLAGEGRPS